jgi:hypothetical protein
MSGFWGLPHLLHPPHHKTGGPGIPASTVDHTYVARTYLPEITSTRGQITSNRSQITSTRGQITSSRGQITSTRGLRVTN